MSNMEDNRSSVKVSDCLGRMKSVYLKQVEVRGPADQFTVLIGLGLIVMRNCYREETCDVVSRVKEILKMIQNQDNYSFIESFVEWISNGGEVQGLDYIENPEYVIKVIWYCVSHVKTFLLTSLQVDNKENAFNEKYVNKVECFCRNLGIRIFVDTENKKYFFGKRDFGLVIHLVKDNGKYSMLCAPQVRVDMVWKAYEEILGLGESFVEVLENTQKGLSLRKRKALLQVFEVVEFLMDGKYQDFLEYCRVLRDVACQHKDVWLYETVCGKYHCALCVFEKSKLRSLLEKECPCSKRISPQDFCKISKIILKLRKKEQLKKQIEQNFTDFQKIAKEPKPNLSNPNHHHSNTGNSSSFINPEDSLDATSISQDSSISIHQEYVTPPQPSPIIQHLSGSSIILQPGHSPTQPNLNSSNYPPYPSTDTNNYASSQRYSNISSSNSTYGFNLAPSKSISGPNLSSFAFNSVSSQNLPLNNYAQPLQSMQPKADTSSALCGMCNSSQAQVLIQIKCKSHQLCVDCIKKDLLKCILCKRQYNSKEHQFIKSYFNL